MPSTPEKVNSNAPVEELQAAVEPTIHAVMDDLSLTTAPEARARIVEEVAADVHAQEAHQGVGDMSVLLAQKIAAIYREFGLTPPGQAALEAEILAYGEGVSGPVPGAPDRAAPLTSDEVRERVRKAQTWANEILSHPSEKKRRTIDAIHASAPFSFHSAEPYVFRVNDVTIEVPEGEVRARDHVDRFGRPDGDICGCLYVYRLVTERGNARRWEAAQQKLLRKTVIYGEVEDRPAEYSNIPQRGRIS
jgi:hypothetical protein